MMRVRGVRDGAACRVVVVVEQPVWRHLLAIDNREGTISRAEAVRRLNGWWTHLAERSAADFLDFAPPGKRSFQRVWGEEDCVHLAHRYRLWRDGRHDEEPQGAEALLAEARALGLVD
ncbi:MAG: hypothetical protein HQL38_03440 [Alphaproteobacteria bacterium]|nr:hypothetical protein [Alphaproteobacteria bacterium]